MPITSSEIAAVNARDALTKNRSLEERIDKQQKTIDLLVQKVMESNDMRFINKINNILDT